MTAPDWYETECRVARGEHPMNQVSSDVQRGSDARTSCPMATTVRTSDCMIDVSGSTSGIAADHIGGAA